MTRLLLERLKRHIQIDEQTVAELRAIGIEKDCGIGDALLQKNLFSDENQRLSFYSSQYHAPVLESLPIEGLSTEFTDRIPISFLKKYLMIPIYQGARCTVAVCPPPRPQALDDLARRLELTEYDMALTRKNGILAALNLAYDMGRGSAEQLVQDMTENGADIIEDIEKTADLLDDTSDAPIIKLVNHIISQSIKAQASDIHIEPYQDSFKVRYRIDGILYDLLTPPKWVQASLISRIKVMARLDIAEKRLPQDGRINIRLGDTEADVRVSTIPTAFGERVVLRLLNKSGSLLSLTDLGIDAQRLNMLNELIESPNGIVLVTGPTGSGKTTSLYAVLSALNRPDINIITIEDPVEYQLKGISQIQVNPKIDLTFARGLRSIVRQDPDVILVGEIRDRETAEIAVQSALTGHLVFSTLHTNDSAGAITRLVDIGIEPFLIASSVIAIIAQRLVRTLCPACKVAYQPDATTLDQLKLPVDHKHDNPLVFYKAGGCSKCFDTGYKGRIGIFEFMHLNTALKSLIQQTCDSNRIKRQAIENRMITLRQDGVQKVLQGITTVEEVFRVAR